MLLLTLFLLVSDTSAFLPSPLRSRLLLSPAFQRSRQVRSSPGSYDRSDNPEEDNDEEWLEEDPENMDWRDFRAKLVLSEGESMAKQIVIDEDCDASTGDCDLDGIGGLFDQVMIPDTKKPYWAYDSGNIIEKGAVILGGVEQDFGFGLRQQYFHKAAILVLDHDESTFTKGIILNRPTDLVLEDDINPGLKWRLWFGGDVQGLESQNPDILCLHSLQDPEAVQASVPVMKNIQWTTFDNAKRLVQAGIAMPEDFWVFCGYAGWGPRQLMGELDRKSWYMVATDSQTLLQQLAKQATGTDPRDAGLETWTLLMDMIGRGETAEEYADEFDDFMLKEWARKHLLSTEAGGGAGERKLLPEDLQFRKNSVDRLINRASAAARGMDVSTGTLLRASPAVRSPFLLEDQEFHKSVVLIVSDDDSNTVGLILNRPASRGLDIQIDCLATGAKRTVTLPLRYGGQYGVKDDEPLMWFHCNPVLRTAGIGTSLCWKQNGIFKCTQEDVTEAISQGLASPDEFLVATGVSVWSKVHGKHGMQGEVREGRFEVIPESLTQHVWDVLCKQQVLTPSNLVPNLSIADEAWSAGADPCKQMPNYGGNGVSLSQFRDHYYNEEEEVVFQTDVKVSQLSDEALRNWVATFLLGSPLSGH